jgi:hypothetical protein
LWFADSARSADRLNGYTPGMVATFR